MTDYTPENSGFPWPGIKTYEITGCRMAGFGEIDGLVPFNQAEWFGLYYRDANGFAVHVADRPTLHSAFKAFVEIPGPKAIGYEGMADTLDTADMLGWSGDWPDADDERPDALDEAEADAIQFLKTKGIYLVFDGEYL